MPDDRRYHDRHRPRKRAIQYAAAFRFYRYRLWNTGTPGQAGRWRRYRSQTWFLVPAARSARVVQNLLPPITEGAGNAGCPLHPQPRVQSVGSTRVSHHRFTGTPGISCAVVYGLLHALPGDRALLPPSLRGSSPQSLAPASGRQDHTTSPSAWATLVSR